VRNVRLWRALLGVDQRTVIEDIEFEEFEEEDAEGEALVVARVRPRSGVSRRCGRCGRRAPWYDRGEGRRRWRGLDWGTVQVVLEADAPRVNCPTHGPTVVAVPWARHHAGHTLAAAIRPVVPFGDVVLVQQEPDRFGRDVQRNEGRQRQRVIVLRDGQHISPWTSAVVALRLSTRHAGSNSVILVQPSCSSCSSESGCSAAASRRMLSARRGSSVGRT
jgi:zinc-finger of transposase IS204/IS1001/IS1096/IS1165